VKAQGIITISPIRKEVEIRAPVPTPIPMPPSMFEQRGVRDLNVEGRHEGADHAGKHGDP
jgi:hypothetical protein